MRRKSELVKKRCPDCNSTNLYKRSRVDDFTPREKNRSSVVKTKIYRCINCGNEFNNPILDQKQGRLKILDKQRKKQEM